jgi:hypothetical protein
MSLIRRSSSPSPLTHKYLRKISAWDNSSPTLVSSYLRVATRFYKRVLAGLSEDMTSKIRLRLFKGTALISDLKCYLICSVSNNQYSWVDYKQTDQSLWHMGARKKIHSQLKWRYFSASCSGRFTPSRTSHLDGRLIVLLLLLQFQVWSVYASTSCKHCGVCDVTVCSFPLPYSPYVETSFSVINQRVLPFPYVRKFRKLVIVHTKVCMRC